MKKDFESRFMPNVKFKLYPINANEHERKRIFSLVKNMPNFPVLYFGYRTNFDGSIIYNGFENQEVMDCYAGNSIKEVSIYEAIPELIPDGMRYNKELDKLVADVMQWEKVDNGGNHIAADGTPFDTIEEALHHNYTRNLTVTSGADEYYSEIKVEVEKDINITLEDRQILDELKKSGKSYLEIINIIKNTDTFLNHNKKDDITPEYYGEKCLCGRKIDWYVIGDLYKKGKGSAWDHAGKKLLRAGEGHKDLATDIKEVIKSLNRWLEQIKDKEEVNAK